MKYEERDQAWLSKSARIAFEKVQEVPETVDTELEDKPKVRPKLPDASNVLATGQRH